VSLDGVQLGGFSIQFDGINLIGEHRDQEKGEPDNMIEMGMRQENLQVPRL